LNSVLFDKRKYFPTKVICVGMNYAEHIEELGNWEPGELVLFMKPNSSISSTLSVPEEVCRYEGEISFIVENGEYAGVGFGLDLTLVEVQKRLKAKGLPWEKAKAFDRSAVFSDFITLERLGNLRLTLSINGSAAQEGGEELMIHNPSQILAEAKRHFTLEDGDIIMTGTPKGVGSYKAGDRITGKIFDGEKLLLEREWVAEIASSG